MRSKEDVKADVPDKQKISKITAWGDISSDEELEEDSRQCWKTQHEVKISHFLTKSELLVNPIDRTHVWTKLVSKLKSQETGLPGRDAIPPLEADIERLVQEN